MRAARAILLPLALCAAAARASAAPADSTHAGAAFHLGRADAAYALVAGSAIAVTAAHDRSWLSDLSTDRSRPAHDVANAAVHMGEPITVGVTLFALDGLSRLAHRDAAAAASERMAFACAAAGVVALAIKEAAGRERPDESASSSHFRPFSGHDALPSGHATLAFALAASLDAEARTPWVRLLAYPAATLTAWARVHERRHWPSDVVAGAALGGWCAWRADGLAHQWFPRGLAVVVLPHRGGADLSLSRRF